MSPQGSVMSSAPSCRDALETLTLDVWKGRAVNGFTTASASTLKPRIAWIFSRKPYVSNNRRSTMVGREYDTRARSPLGGIARRLSSENDFSYVQRLIERTRVSPTPGCINNVLPIQHHPFASRPDLHPYPVKTWPYWHACLLYTSPSPRDGLLSRMPSSA